jgi:hypothetical protein
MKDLRIGVGQAAVLFFALVIQGCDGSNPPPPRNVISSVEIVPSQNEALGVPLAFVVKGWGTCGRFAIDWGDGSTDNVVPAQRTSCVVNPDPAEPKPHFRCSIEHTYTGWQGGKTVTVTAQQGCEGSVKTRFATDPPVYALALGRPGPNTCDPVPGKPSVQNRSVVRITTLPVNAPCPGIYYQNVTPHCYDADGIAAPATTPGFPTSLAFPGMRPFSLVLRVGTQVVQGGTSMSFVANQTAPLEICVNEHDSTAGRGGLQINIRTDEMGPPEPFTARLTFGGAASAYPPTCDSTVTTGCAVGVQLLNQTRAAQVTVLPGLGPVLVQSITLYDLNIAADPSWTTVRAKIYNSDGTLNASAQISVSPTTPQQEVTIPISATLVEGGTFRVGFYVSTSTGNPVPATFLVPTGWQSPSNSPPYNETTGFFKIESSWESPGDTFPSNNSLNVPKIVISGRR